MSRRDSELGIHHDTFTVFTNQSGQVGCRLALPCIRARGTRDRAAADSGCRNRALRVTYCRWLAQLPGETTVRCALNHHRVLLLDCAGEAAAATLGAATTTGGAVADWIIPSHIGLDLKQVEGNCARVHWQPRLPAQGVSTGSLVLVSAGGHRPQESTQ